MGTANAWLKRNFQLMPGAQWLELLCRHIPYRFEHPVRYVGWYSTRCRGQRARAAALALAVQAADDGQLVAARARSACARLIHKVYEVDPLECLKCGARMRVIALGQTCAAAAVGIDCSVIYH